MMMLAMHDQDYHSYLLDSRLNLSEHGQLTSSPMTRQHPISAEELWDSYFGSNDFVYQGLNLDLIQERVHQTDTRKPPDHSLNPSRAQQKIYPSVGVDGSLTKELRETRLPTSDIPSRHPVS